MRAAVAAYGSYHDERFNQRSEGHPAGGGYHATPDGSSRAVLVAHETPEAARILREHLAPPCTPNTLLLSVDGAMISMVQGLNMSGHPLVVPRV
jgi:hypothetical protein